MAVAIEIVGVVEMSVRTQVVQAEGFTVYSLTRNWNC